MAINKKVFEKRLEAFKQYAENSNHYKKEIITSASGNMYIISRNRPITKTYNSYNVTKSTFDKYGKEFSYPNSQMLLMFTKTGKFLFKDVRDKKLKNITRRFNELYFIGRKCEWLSEYLELQDFRIARQFSSLNSFKIWLGYEFISDTEFSSLVRNELNIELLIQFKLKDKEERVNLINLLKLDEASTIKDTLNMMVQLNIDQQIPRGKTTLKELHDNLSKQLKVKNTPLIAVEVTLTNFDIPYEYTIIKSSHELVERGITNKHCIGSYYNKMYTDLFLVVEGYDCHITKNYEGKWYVSQMRGFANKDAPSEMKFAIQKALDNAQISIKNVMPIDKVKEIEEELFNAFDFAF